MRASFPSESTNTGTFTGQYSDDYVSPASAGYTLPTATNAVLGGVKPDGTTLTNIAGVLSVTYGATAATACVGNDARLSDSRPASDVSAWAKAGTKPSYTAAEVGAEPSLGNPGVNGMAPSSTTAGVRSWVSRPWVLWTKYTVTTLAGWTTAATIIGAVGTGKGTLTIPANTLQVGTVVRIRAKGVYGSTTAAPTLNWLLALGGTTMCTSGALSMTTVSMTARPWEMEIELICVATGATATLKANGGVWGANTISASNYWPMVQNTAVNINTAIDQAITLTLACGTSNAANTVSMHHCTIEVIPPPAA